MLRLIKILPQYVLPHHLLSALMYRLARIGTPWFKSLFIKSFIRLYGVDMSIAREPDPDRYRTFNDFFIRPLRDGTRPVDPGPGSVVSPVDGRVSQYGAIAGGQILQAKGRSFSVSDLLASDSELAARLSNGAFMTLYLAPPDYHRIHMPVGGRLQSLIPVPGRLFSVSPATTAGVDRLFARNERLVNIFAMDQGVMALVMVGAIFVGSMETVWAGEVRPGPGQIEPRYYADEFYYAKGEEIGRFNMGSTVILLFEPDRVVWRADLTPGKRVKMGEKIGTLPEVKE